MAFTSARTDDIRQTGSGELFGSTNIVLTSDTFEDNLVVGRFAKLDTGSVDNMDASASPVLAGVVLRKPQNAIEDASAIDSALFDEIDYVRFGIVSVDGVAAEAPDMFDDIYAVNVAGADIGKATITTTNNVNANAEFLRTLDSGVWLIRLK